MHISLGTNCCPKSQICIVRVEAKSVKRTVVFRLNAFMHQIEYKTTFKEIMKHNFQSNAAHLIELIGIDNSN